jgi:hypothetical protein
MSQAHSPKVSPGRTLHARVSLDLAVHPQLRARNATFFYHYPTGRNQRERDFFASKSWTGPIAMRGLMHSMALESRCTSSKAAIKARCWKTWIERSHAMKSSELNEVAEMSSGLHGVSHFRNAICTLGIGTN